MIAYLICHGKTTARYLYFLIVLVLGTALEEINWNLPTTLIGTNIIDYDIHISTI